MKELLYKDYVNLPLKRRLEKLKQRILYLLEPYERALVNKAMTEVQESDEYLEQDEIVKLSKA